VHPLRSGVEPSLVLLEIRFVDRVESESIHRALVLAASRYLYPDAESVGEPLEKETRSCETCTPQRAERMHDAP